MVALETDRRLAKSCIQRVAALLGMELNSGADWAAGHSYLQGGLALWQAKCIRSYVEDKLGSSIGSTDLAGVVQLSTSHFCGVFRRIVGINLDAWRHQIPVRPAPNSSVGEQIPLRTAR